MPSRHRLQQCAISISILSLIYNTAEGVVSVVFGTESSSHALVFYGLQSAVEVISDFLVTWRFFSVLKQDDTARNPSHTSPQVIRIERIATVAIGTLLVALTIAAIVTSAISLAAHDHPSTTLPAILIAAISTGFTLLMYIIKRYLARALDSSALNGEALCGLCCAQLSVVVLIGSLIYHEWKGGWWVDAASTIVIGIMFGWEGIKLIKWSRHPDFDGGVSEPFNDADVPKCATPSADPEKPNEPGQEPSLCSCSECCGCCKKAELVKEEHV